MCLSSVVLVRSVGKRRMLVDPKCSYIYSGHSSIIRAHAEQMNARCSQAFVICEQASFAFLPITSRSRVGQAGFA